MRRRPLRPMLYRAVRRQAGRPVWGVPPLLVTLGVALLLAAGLIRLLELRLRPAVEQIASAQVQNDMTALLEQAITQDLARRGVSYGDLIQIQRDETGAITALTTDTARLNQLRAQLTQTVLAALEGVDVSTIRVPLGSLLDFELLWARGPSLKVRSMTVGTVRAEFDSELASAGVNQTLHRVWLEVSVPLTVLLPGGAFQVPVCTRLVVAETVIVGQVPGAYLQLPQ